MVADRDVVVKILIEVRLSIGIQIMQAGYLVTAEHIYFVVHDFQTQWLEQAGGESAPLEFFKVFIDAAHDPHITCHGTHCRGFAVLKEIKSTTTDP